MKYSVSVEQGPYDRISEEYYDGELHPTSRNLGEASAQFLLRALEQVPLVGKLLLEVGAGRSLVAECLDKLGSLGNDLVITDISLKMLRYTEPSRGRYKLSIANATELPLRDRSVDVVVSSLGDPYNVSLFWSEASRVLRKQGFLIYTSPSREWAERYRSEVNDPDDKAVFILRSGQRVEVHSHIKRPIEMVTEMAGYGFKCLFHEQVSIKSLSSPLSTKLVVEEGNDLPVLDGYVFQRQ